MKNFKPLIILSLLFISMLAFLPGTLHVRASTGEVCLQPAGTVGCPGAPVLFASSGSTLNVAVNIVGSDSLNGFDISISTDNTVLTAADADLTGTIVTSATTLLKCLDGVLVVGSACASQDGPGVLHFSAVKTGALVGGSGLLFTAVYNVVASTPGIPMSFTVDATDCASTSVGSGVCVTISNGTTTPNAETATGASFSNLSDFALDCVPASHTIAPGATGDSVCTLTSFGGFTDFIDLTLFPSAGLSASTDDTTLLLPADGTVSTMLHVSAASAGSYSVLVSATADQILQGAAISHSFTVPVTVTPPDWSIAASPTTLVIPPGSSDTSTITVASISGFSGIVSLSVSAAPLTATLAPASVNLVCCSSGTSTLTVTVPGGTASGLYPVVVTGTGSGTHSVTVMVNVGEPDFALAASPDVLNIPRVAPIHSGASSLNIASINNFAAVLTITATVSGPVGQVPGEIAGAALTTSLSTSTITLPAGGTDSSTLLMTVLKASTGTGLHTVTVTVSGGSKSHTVLVLAYVTDFSLTLRDPVISLINDPATIMAHPVQTVMTVRALGAPNQTISLGFDTAATSPGTQPPIAGTGAATAYTYSPSTGRVISALPASDTTKQRCFMAVYDSSGLVVPSPATGSITTFLAPVVHINGDLDGDPPDFNGCRFDSGGGQSNFGGGPSPGVNTGDAPIDDFPMPTVEVLPGTPNGMYTAKVCLLGGIVYNCVDLTINLVAPPAAPYFSQWSAVKPHTVHLSSGTTATFKMGVTNPSSITEYVQVVVTAVDGIGGTASASSGVIAIAPGATVQNIQVVMDVSGLSGVVNYSGSISYGVAPAFLTENSAATVVTKSTGSFLVSP